MNKKKFIRVLSIGAILGGLVSAGIHIEAKAAVDAYTIKVQNEIYRYDKYELIQDFLNYKRGNTAKLYDDFTDKLKKGNGFYAFQDSKRGYVDYNTIKKAFIKTKQEEKLFNIEEFIQSEETKVIDVPSIQRAVVTKNGQVKYEISLKENLDNKDKEDNDNESENNKDVVNNDNKNSKSKSSNNHKRKHRHKSSTVVKENKKEQEEKAKQEQLKKEQEEKAKQEQSKKEQEEKAKQEQSKKEQEEKAKQEQLKKEQEEKAKQEQLKKSADIQVVQQCKDKLKLGNLNNVNADLSLPTMGENGVSIVWTSNNSDVVTNNGKVTRQEDSVGDVVVTLTATLTKGEAKETKEFKVTVKAKKELVANNKEEFYNILKNTIDNCQSTVKIKVLNYNDVDYKLDIINQILLEHPELDYGKPETKAQIFSYGGKERILDITLNYKKDATTVKQEKQKAQQEIKRILNTVIKPGMTDFEKELALHDYIVKTADYDTENYKKGTTTLEDHTAYGVLVDHVGVCESYAKAMYELLNGAGIECKYVTGYSKHNGVKGGGHAWNMVKLENQWYNIDITWDDPVSDRNGTASFKPDVNFKETVNHTYFNIPDSIFNNDHIRGDFEQKNYPTCTATKYSYSNMDIDEYTSDGTLIERVTSKDELDAKILDALKNKGKTLRLRIKGFKMTQEELSNEVKSVAEQNKLGGLKWNTSAPDDYHVNYSFNW